MFRISVSTSMTPTRCVPVSRSIWGARRLPDLSAAESESRIPADWAISQPVSAPRAALRFRLATAGQDRGPRRLRNVLREFQRIELPQFGGLKRTAVAAGLGLAELRSDACSRTSNWQHSRIRSPIRRCSPRRISRWSIPTSTFPISCKEVCRSNVRFFRIPWSPSALLGRMEFTWPLPAPTT